MPAENFAQNQEPLLQHGADSFGHIIWKRSPRPWLVALFLVQPRPFLRLPRTQVMRRSHQQGSL
jgi:hypothetical protein